MQKDKEKDCKELADPFYTESNVRHLEMVMNDVRAGKAHFAEHELIEDD